MSFSMLLEDLNKPVRTTVIEKISKRRYNAWRGMYLFDAIKGLSYGQSFCRHFAISDNILKYDDRADSAHRYICKTYVKPGL